jgi:imidazolonepropionase-like amidohydrolase
MDEVIALKPDLVLANPPDPPRSKMAVLVRGAVIEAIRPAAQVPAGASILELPGATLMPALIDAHVHLTLCGCCTPRETMLREDDQMLLLRASENARQALAAGIATLRDCGDRNGVTFALRRAIAAGVMPGPRLLLSGPPLTSMGGHCHFMHGEVASRAQMARAIDSAAGQGADFIKIMATGGGLTPGTDSLKLQFTAGDLAFMVSEANGRGLYVAAHAHSPEAIRACVEAGIRSIEHATFVHRGAIAADGDTLRAMSKLRVIAVPTGIPAVIATRAGRTLGLAKEIGLTSQEFLEGRRRVLRDLAANGVEMIAGSDAGATNVGFSSLLGEIELLAEAFDSIPRALAAGTSSAADALGVADTGRIREGASADLLAVYGNPNEDLSSLRRVALVMAQGRVVRKEAA